MGEISSGNAKSVDVYSVDWEVEVVEYEVLTAELPATSERKAIFQTVANFFRDSSAPAGGLCSSVAASKSKSPKLFLFRG